MSQSEDQQFCLRWNNFQANITSQFETLRDDEDFTDVTIACDGQRIQAHKVVLSACSPFFKELFKSNPCSHPIIFMRDVEARHIIALMEFMYAGEVNVAQAHLSTFLKTAESLKIRGLTDTSGEPHHVAQEDTLFLNPQSSSKTSFAKNKPKSSQDLYASSSVSSPPQKRQCKSESELPKMKREEIVNPFAFQSEVRGQSEVSKVSVQPKVELPDYLSEEENDNEPDIGGLGEGYIDGESYAGGMEIGPQTSGYGFKDSSQDLHHGARYRKRRLSEDWYRPYPPEQTAFTYQDNPDPHSWQWDKKETDKKFRLVKLGEGVEVREDQLRALKRSDYRKLTRGLAGLLFSPGELATCSVTGQRWSRAPTEDLRPVKPALDRAKVQAIISYVASRFPLAEISRIKQVLAYKCKENSTALKLKAVRSYSTQENK